MNINPSGYGRTPRSSHLSRRSVLVGGLAVASAPLWATKVLAAPTDGVQRDFGFDPPQPADKVFVRPIMFPVLPDPVLGKASWSDTYLAPRGGGRHHEGQDLMGKKMLKLLACVDGTIVELKYGSGGNSLYLQGDDGWYYCYLHINNDTPGTDDAKNDRRYAFPDGVVEGTKVKKGDHIAYLGDSGNAEGSGSHCHFEIRMPNAKWYQASAVNPKYSLDKAEPAKLGGGGPSTPPAADAFAPFAAASAFATRQAKDFLRVTPTASWVSSAAGRLDAGSVTPDDFIRSLLDEPAQAHVVAPTIRLYLAYFLRRPETGGLNFWLGKAGSGFSLDNISQNFATSAEFENRYGKLGNADFVRQIYRNLFDREPDAGGHLYWTHKLDHGKSRGWTMRQLCESNEYVGRTADEVGVVSAFSAMLGRAPGADDYTNWTTMSRANTGALSMLIGILRKGDEYARRVG